MACKPQNRLERTTGAKNRNQEKHRWTKVGPICRKTLRQISHVHYKWLRSHPFKLLRTYRFKPLYKGNGSIHDRHMRNCSNLRCLVMNLNEGAMLTSN